MLIQALSSGNRGGNSVIVHGSIIFDDSQDQLYASEVRATALNGHRCFSSRHKHIGSDHLTLPTLEEVRASIPVFALIESCSTSQEVADKIRTHAEKAGLRMLKPRVRKRTNDFLISIRGGNGFLRLSQAIAEADSKK